MEDHKELLALLNTPNLLDSHFPLPLYQASLYQLIVVMWYLWIYTRWFCAFCILQPLVIGWYFQSSKETTESSDSSVAKETINKFIHQNPELSIGFKITSTTGLVLEIITRVAISSHFRPKNFFPLLCHDLVSEIFLNASGLQPCKNQLNISFLCGDI